MNARKATKDELLAAGKSTSSKGYIVDGELVSYRTYLNIIAREKGFSSESHRHRAADSRKDKAFKVTQQRTYRHMPITSEALNMFVKSSDTAAFMTIGIRNEQGKLLGYRQSETFSPKADQDTLDFIIDSMFSDKDVYAEVTPDKLVSFTYINF